MRYAFSGYWGVFLRVSGREGWVGWVEERRVLWSEAFVKIGELRGCEMEGMGKMVWVLRWDKCFVVLSNHWPHLAIQPISQ